MSRSTKVLNGFQEHPNETPELLSQSLVDFELELSRLSSNELHSIRQALERAPQIANDENFRLAFLRTEIFNIEKAAKRFAKYWTTRIDLFGETKAFLPMTQNGALCDDAEFLKYGFTCVMPHHNERIIYIDPDRKPRESYDIDGICRATRYVVEKAILHCEELPRKGALYIVDLRTIRHFPIRLVKRLSDVTEDAVPIRTTEICIINSPSRMLGLAINFMKNFLKTKVRDRIHVVQTSETLKRLLGVSLEEVMAINHAAWLEEMARHEEKRGIQHFSCKSLMSGIF